MRRAQCFLIPSALIYREMVKRHGRRQCSRGPLVVRESTVTWLRFYDGCCDNDDRLVATYRSHALGNICLYGSIFGSHDVARCSRGRSYLVALCYRCCDNHDATSESITFSHIGILSEYMIWERSGSRGVARGSRGRSLLGRASRWAL